jgi:hypothetical protein
MYIKYIYKFNISSKIIVKIYEIKLNKTNLFK